LDDILILLVGKSINVILQNKHGCLVCPHNKIRYNITYVTLPDQCVDQIWTRKNCFRYLKLMSTLNAAICTTISYTLWVEWYYLKNNYLTLRSKVKVPQRSLRYAKHCLMVMHPHTKYHWPISKDKNAMARTRKYYLKNQGQRSRSHKGH
jgi:hypothetical protein